MSVTVTMSVDLKRAAVICCCFVFSSAVRPDSFFASFTALEALPDDEDDDVDVDSTEGGATSFFLSTAHSAETERETQSSTVAVSSRTRGGSSCTLEAQAQTVPGAADPLLAAPPGSS